jgi:hypothetical protein
MDNWKQYGRKRWLLIKLLTKPTQLYDLLAAANPVIFLEGKFVPVLN